MEPKTISIPVEVALTVTDAAKAGARNSSGDLKRIQAIHDDAYALGAQCGMPAKDAEHIPSEPASVEGEALKALDEDGRIGGLAVRFGSEDEPDLSASKDFFTAKTAFWLATDTPISLPMIYDHGFDPDTSDDALIGNWTKAIVKPEGLWLEGQINRAHAYAKAIMDLVRRGLVRISTDSANHLVQREAKSAGIHEITRWPILAASITPSAAEPRLTPLQPVKAAELPEVPASETPDRSATGDEQSADDRRRRIAVELDLLTLERSTQ